MSRKRYCQTLKTFRIISCEMKISPLILSCWCFSCLHIHRIGVATVYRSVVLKNKSLGTLDI